MSMNLDDIAIFKIKNRDYRCIIIGLRKSEAINLMQNIDMIEKSGTLYQEQFLKLYWKFLFNKKSEKLYIKKNIKMFESIYKNGKKL